MKEDKKNKGSNSKDTKDKKGPSHRPLTFNTEVNKAKISGLNQCEGMEPEKTANVYDIH